MKAPWHDYKGDDIHDGDEVVHPSGEYGVVVRYHDIPEPLDAWRIHYESGEVGRMCLQVGWKGQLHVAPKDRSSPE